jgi:tripartite-type tricarboxylate transporter receptor subunit TctC
VFDGNGAFHCGPGYDMVTGLGTPDAWNLVRDLAPVGMVSYSSHLLSAHPAVPANSVKELIALAKKKPGDISYGSAGNGTLNHLLGEMLKKQEAMLIVPTTIYAAMPAGR